MRFGKDEPHDINEAALHVCEPNTVPTSVFNHFYPLKLKFGFLIKYSKT
jgi:hypothetical protein